MKPFEASELPREVELSNNLIKLLTDTYEIYGEYKGYLKTIKINYKFLIESFLTNDIYYSLKIENMKLDKQDMFYAPYKIKSNTYTIFNNLKKVFMQGLSLSNEIVFNKEYFSYLHKTLYMNCKKDNQTKGSGRYRKIQTYILKPGLAGSSVSFVPPVYSQINSLMNNLYNYMNDNNDNYFLSLPLTHFQLQRIHPFVSGNGILGRMLVPLQLSIYKKEAPMLFISESIEFYRNTYFTLLSANADIKDEEFITFFLKCIIKQCEFNINKIKKINKVYEKDYESFKKTIGGTTIYKVYPHIVKRIVFTTNDIVNDTNLHINSINKVLNKLVESGYLIKEKKQDSKRVTFKYKNMCDVFIE